MPYPSLLGLRAGSPLALPPAITSLVRRSDRTPQLVRRLASALAGVIASQHRAGAPRHEPPRAPVDLACGQIVRQKRPNSAVRPKSAAYPARAPAAWCTPLLPE